MHEPSPILVAWSVGLARNIFIATDVGGVICHAVWRDWKGWGLLPCNATATIGEGPDSAVSVLGPLCV